MHAPESLEAAFLVYRDTREPAALAVVYDGASSRLLAVALHLSNTVAGAEDAVQETFLFALQNPERWDATRPLLPWLLGILANKLHKTDARAQRTPDPDRLYLPIVRGPDAEFEANEVLERIEQAITELPQPYRTVVLLRLRNGLSPADIAVALGRKPSTVRAQLTRGVEMLRKALPASVAALLVGSTMAARGLDAAREVVLGRAAQMESAMRWQHAARILRLGSLAAAGLAAAALVVWAAWPDSVVAPVQAHVAEATRPVAVEADSVREVVLPLAGVVPAADRVEARVLGALTVAVSRGGVPMLAVPVEIEPLGDQPSVFEHLTVTRGSSWCEMVSGRPCAQEALLSGRTGEDGASAFEALSPGLWICRALDASAVVHVRADATERVDLVVDPMAGILRGLVLDPDGRPVAGAPVWQCQEQRTPFAEVVTHADASGRFAVAVVPRVAVGALLPGSAPVGVFVTERDASAYREVVLQFAAPGAALSGIVHDAKGTPVAGAEVEVGHANDSGAVIARMEPQVLSRPVRTHTDADGHFRFASLAPGETVVLARAPGMGIQRRIVGLSPGAIGDVELALPAAVTLTGVVRDARGGPIPRAAVFVGRRGALSYCATVTDRDGAYRLTGITPGRPTVEVVDYRGGFASRELRCVPGEHGTWDVVLTPDDLRVSGRVVDAMGQPFTNGWVGYWRLGNMQAQQLDAQGRFTLQLSEREAALPYRVEVYDQDPRDAKASVRADPCAIAPGPAPGSEGFVVRLPADWRPTAWLRGRLLTSAGAPARATLRVAHAIGRRVWRAGLVAPADDGSFALGPLTPGRYRVVVDDLYGYGPFDVDTAGQDVGTLHLPADDGSSKELISLHMAPLFPDSVSITEPFQLEVRDPQGRLVESKFRPAGVDGATDYWVELLPGTFTLTATSDSGLVANCTVEVDRARARYRALLLRFDRP